MAAEGAHEIGRTGVMKVKQYLESTTHLRMPWTAYDHEAMCRLQRLDRSRKTYDLRGHFLGDHRHPLFVESKKYSSPSSQGKLYRTFVADVYSHVARAVRDDMDDEAEFMWITWHPFALGEWMNLTTHTYIRDSLAEHPAALKLPDGETSEHASIDDDLCRTVASRLWVIVVSDRQQDLVLSPDELKKALLNIDRAGA